MAQVLITVEPALGLDQANRFGNQGPNGGLGTDQRLFDVGDLGAGHAISGPMKRRSQQRAAEGWHRTRLMAPDS